jgi:hypothetical protein
VICQTLPYQNWNSFLFFFHDVGIATG